MKNKGYKIFSVISLVITVFYCVVNLFTIILLNMTVSENNIALGIIGSVFSLDVFTWPVYVAFAIVTLIIKYLKDKKYNANTILHAIFMVLSFVEMYHIISKGF
ncbi:MAG: hypothetical protein J6B37_04920 [Clostridia bacterium]|nr:hypothetical protein [Clostridia bacterium]